MGKVESIFADYTTDSGYTDWDDYKESKITVISWKSRVSPTEARKKHVYLYIYITPMSSNFEAFTGDWEQV